MRPGTDRVLKRGSGDFGEEPIASRLAMHEDLAYTKYAHAAATDRNQWTEGDATAGFRTGGRSDCQMKCFGRRMARALEILRLRN